MPKPASLRFSDISLGQEAHFDVQITESLVQDFSRLSGDTNPLHTDEAYASETRFEGRIAHGMLIASFFSQLVGMHLPGLYSLYLSQKTTFRKPCRIGSTVRIEGKVIQKNEATRTIMLQTRALDESGECLVDGEALVRILQ